MFSRIETIAEKKMAGKPASMSLIQNSTGSLWAGFMPKLKEIKNRVSSGLYSLQVYPDDYFRNFNPAASFTKWALTEVSSCDELPEGISSFLLPAGNYAVFIHKGDSTRFPQTLQLIFNEWLPVSGYLLDNRPHFELLGERYKNNDPESEEEVWIPIRQNPDTNE
jgi:AraC family transcriptional regulator